MTTMTKSCYLAALAGENNSGTPPIWLMRQAGRYLPEYRVLREKHGFLEMMKTPALATEITLQPIRRFGFDAAILFSDILVTAEALGTPIKFVEGKGPVIENRITSLAEAQKLDAQNAPGKLHYVGEAVRELKKQLGRTPLIGFAGAPYTVASYMIEGGSSKDHMNAKRFLFEHAEAAELLVEKLIQITTDYLNFQIDCGADAIQIFESWAASLAFEEFKIWSLAPVEKIIAGVRKKHPHTPITFFAKGTSLSALKLSSASALGIDWTQNLVDTRKTLGPKITLQGNLDPHLLLAPWPKLKTALNQILAPMAQDPAYIFNLGHGITPQVDPEQVQSMVAFIREGQFHA